MAQDAVQLYVEVDRGDGFVETRGVSAATNEEALEMLRSFAKDGPILRVLNRFGEDRTEQYLPELA